jgi:hypothetical protein
MLGTLKQKEEVVVGVLKRKNLKEKKKLIKY